MDQEGFCKILEIKRPQVSIVKSAVRSAHDVFYHHIPTAATQLRNYGRAFDDKSTRERFFEEYGVDVYNPALHLVVGRRVEPTFLGELREFQRREQIVVKSWDSLLEELKRRP